MDDIAAMVAEAVARRVKAAADAQRAAAAAGGRRALQARPTAAPQNVVAASPPGTAAKPSVPMGRAPAPLAPVAPRPVVSETSLPEDGLPGLPMTIFEEAAEARPQLLSAFTGQGLLAGIVLSEALGRPIALREGGSGTPF